MEPEICPSTPQTRHRLFYAQADPCLPADELQSVFEEFGPVASVRMIEDKATNSSSGCGYVEYASAAHAQAAVSALHGGTRLAAPGLRFTVAFAMLERREMQESGSWQGVQSALDQDGNTVEDPEEVERCRRTVYFARVPPCVPVEELEELFGSCGKVVNVNLFKPWATSKTSKGCGLVEFATEEAAKKARASLHEFSYWPNARYPLLVEAALPSALKPPKVAKPPRQQQPKAPKSSSYSMGQAERVRQQLMAGKAMGGGWGHMGAMGGHPGLMGAGSGPTTRLYNPALGTLMQVQGLHGANMAAKMGMAAAQQQVQQQQQQQQYMWDASCGAGASSSSNMSSELLLQQLGMGRGGGAVASTGLVPGLVPLAVSAAPAPDVTPYDRLASATAGWGTEVPVQVAPLMTAQAGGYVELPQAMQWGRDDTMSSASSNLTLSGTHLSGPGGMSGHHGEDLSNSGYNLVPAQGMGLRPVPMQAAHQLPMQNTGPILLQQQAPMLMPMNMMLGNGSSGNGMVQRSAGGGMAMAQPAAPMQQQQQQAMQQQQQAMQQQLQLMLTPNDVASLSGHLGALSSLTQVGAAIEAHPGVGLALVLTGSHDQLAHAQNYIQLMRGSAQ